MIRSAFALCLLVFGPPAVGETPATAGSGSDDARQDADGATVSLIRVDETITPTTTNYIRRGISRAREAGSAGLIIEMDTPGGLLESTTDIVQTLFESDFPIIVYVAPDGARAASAGTFITMAAHVAAMAPSTTIGAASPVTMSPGGGEPDTVMQQKLFNFSESFMRTIADRRDRNAEWAMSAVREGASATETEALEMNVIDLVATDREDLLRQIDGREVEEDTLRTAGASIEEIPKNLAERVLGFITHPQVMLVLTLIAIYGIIGEVTNPGAIIPGLAGVIALILLLYASASMPLNIAGFALIGLAIVLFIAEAFTPTFGLLLTGGAVAFFLGALMLFQELPEPLALSWAWLVPATLLTTLFFAWIATEGIRAQFTPSRTGLESMVGKRARVVDAVSREGGRVFVSGEYWNAVSDEEIGEGTWCEVEGVEGLTMRVRPMERAERESSRA